MASYTRDKKTGKPVLQSRIETPYQPDQEKPASTPASELPEPKKEDGK